jgi:hypothetical protein
MLLTSYNRARSVSAGRLGSGAGLASFYNLRIVPLKNLDEGVIPRDKEVDGL